MFQNLVKDPIKTFERLSGILRVYSKVLVENLVNRRLLISASCDNVLIIIAYVTTEDRGGLLGLEDGGSVWRPPGVKEVVLASGDKPFARVGKFKAEDTTLVEVQLIFVWFVTVKHLHVGVLHPNSEPVSRGAPAQAEYLAAEVVLLQLSALPEVPGPHRVVQASGPQLGAVS